VELLKGIAEHFQCTNILDRGDCSVENFDISEKQITKRQHYIPKVYLKQFAFDEQKTPHVYAVFPDKNHPCPVSIDKICCCASLYDQIAIDPESEDKIYIAPNEIENIFSVIEGKYALIVSKIKEILNKKCEFELSTEEIGALRGFISSLLSRNPIFVHISNCIVDRMYAQNPTYMEYIRRTYPDVPSNVVISYIANDFFKKQLFISILALADTMENSQLCIFRTKDSTFVTSDMPVVNIWGENSGIKYDLVGMPISPELFVAFIDTVYDVPKVLSIDSQSVMRINCRQRKAKSILISNKKEILSFIDFSYVYGEKENDDDFFSQLLGPDKDRIMEEYHEIMNSQKIKYWE